MEYELLYLINSLGVLTVGLIVVYHFIGTRGLTQASKRSPKTTRDATAAHNF